MIILTFIVSIGLVSGSGSLLAHACFHAGMNSENGL
jgi:hypothetical protein